MSNQVYEINVNTTLQDVTDTYKPRKGDRVECIIRHVPGIPERISASYLVITVDDNWTIYMNERTETRHYTRN